MLGKGRQRSGDGKDNKSREEKNEGEQWLLSIGSTNGLPLAWAFFSDLARQRHCDHPAHNEGQESCEANSGAGGLSKAYRVPS